MAVNSGARMWGPFKELFQLVESAIIKKHPEATQDLEVALRKHKPDFYALLQNPAKNGEHRKNVHKADTVGLTVQGHKAPISLSRAFIEEALIISDLFDLNEYAAVELLLAGESQLPYFPGLTRGLVAVLLYYDGRQSLVNALRLLIQGRQGHTWTLGLGDDLAHMATKFTDQLVEEGIIGKLLDLLTTTNLEKEVERLEQERALGTPGHRQQVVTLIKGIDLALSECVFGLACQTSLSKEDVVRLLCHLSKVKLVKPEGPLDHVTTHLLMAFLYSIDIRVLAQDDSQELADSLDILSDAGYVPSIHKELVNGPEWTVRPLKTVAQLAWGLTLRALAQYANNQGMNDHVEQDEMVIDLAVEQGVFEFMREALVSTDFFHNEEFFLRQVHNLLADFVVQMPLKVKELRNRGDEAARIIQAHNQEGLQPPTHLRRHFEHLLGIIGDLYMKDPLKLELSTEFWQSPDVMTTHLYTQKPAHRQVSLFKFLRMAGDLLPPSLYIPYIHMLTGLANSEKTAHLCFNLLRTNNSSQTAGGTVTWDHFFSSMHQYYRQLRQEAAPLGFNDLPHVYRQPGGPRIISNQEVEGLCYVLQLIRTVVKHDREAGISMCENTQWLAQVLLVGMVGCSVPPLLKAALLDTLAALATIQECTHSIWQNIENSQILTTVPTASGMQAQPSGLQVELEEVETRNEEFPISKGFLQLLDNLTDYPTPPGLGAGYRAPGFHPYLDYLRESILLKFSTRAYKNPAEKWEIGCGVLRILHKLVSQHQPAGEDFVDQMIHLQGGSMTQAPKPAGHTIILHMLNDTPTLKTILFIIDEATRMLDRHTEFPGRNELVQAALLCLRLVETVLDKQIGFMELLRDSGATVLAANLDSLLLGINPRTGQPDHLLNITKYLTYNSEFAEHALVSVQILWRVCMSSVVQPEIVGLLTAKQDVWKDLLHGFVECLETETVETDVADIIADEDETIIEIRNSTRQYIVRLLLRSLEQSTPNLAHALLGFDIRKPIAKATLQDPGVLGCPRTCLHAIMTILDRGMAERGGAYVGTNAVPLAVQETPRLAELAYRLVYVLCANKDTASPTLRYLRTAHDFLYRHLQQLPFQSPTPVNEMLLLRQQSWVMKAVAIELRLTAANRQRSHAQRLLDSLLDDQPYSAKAIDLSAFEAEYTFDADITGFQSRTFAGQHKSAGQCRRRLLRVLDSIDLQQEYSEWPELDLLEPAAVQSLVGACQQWTHDGSTQVVEVKALHQTLTSHLNTMQPTSAQRPHIIEEINLICRCAAKHNQVREAVWSKKAGFEAWRQVVEVVVCGCGEELLTTEARHMFLLEILQDVLMKVSNENAASELTGAGAGVILTCMANLRQCFLSSPDSSMSSYTSDSALGFGQSLVTPGNLSASSLQVILKKLIEFIMTSNSTLQRVRANLYGALLYYLQIVQKPKHTQSADIEPSGVGSALTSKDTEYEKLQRETVNTVSSYGHGFMDIVCRDACDGHHAGRMLALEVLDCMVNIDRTGGWLAFLGSQGYLQHLVDSLVQDDPSLTALLTTQDHSLRPLYIFECKLGLLTRIGESASGSQSLLQCEVMTRLTQLTALDMRPEQHRLAEYDDALPEPLSRYQQMFFPVLKLCLAIQTSLGIENRQASNQVLGFLAGHVDVFSTILRDRPILLHQSALEELVLVTAIVGRAVLHGIEDEAGIESGLLNMEGVAGRLRRQLLGLLPRYCLNDKLVRQIGILEGDSPRGLMLSLQRIMANLLAFPRQLMTLSGVNNKTCSIIFTPSMLEATTKGSTDNEISCSGTVTPSLGVVVYLLRQGADQLLQAYDTHKHTQSKIQNVANLPAEELREMSGGNEKMSSTQRQVLALGKLRARAVSSASQLHALAYIIENCLLILWRHFEFYLVHASISDTRPMTKVAFRPTNIRRLHESISVDSEDSSVWGQSVGSDLINMEQLTCLKRDIHMCLGEPLFAKLQEIDMVYLRNRSRYCFTEALIRRLKNMVNLCIS